MPTASTREVEAGDREMIICDVHSKLHEGQPQKHSKISSHNTTKVLNNHLAKDRHCNAVPHGGTSFSPPKTNHSACQERGYAVYWSSTQILTANLPSTITTARQTPTAESTLESHPSPRQAHEVTGREA